MEDETKEVTKKVISKPSMRIKMYSRGFLGGRERPRTSRAKAQNPT